LKKEILKTTMVLKSEGTILYPTDTIWGLGCLVSSEKAIKQLYTIKQRPDHKAFIVLVNSLSMLEHYVGVIDPKLYDLLNQQQHPTTVIYPQAQHLSNKLLGPDGSIGIRIANDPFCEQLIDKVGEAIVSTSANISGHPSPTCFEDIPLVLKEQLDYVVHTSMETKKIGIQKPSTILKWDPIGEQVIVIRA